MRTSSMLEQLMEALRCLPGVGPKSAQRMAFHLLQRNRKGGLQLAEALSQAMTEIGHCDQCRTLQSKTLVMSVSTLSGKRTGRSASWKPLPILLQLKQRDSIQVVILF